VSHEGDWADVTSSSLSAAASTDSPGSTFPPNPLYLWNVLELQWATHDPSLFDLHAFPEAPLFVAE
jgi:hypothetical protein